MKLLPGLALPAVLFANLVGGNARAEDLYVMGLPQIRTAIEAKFLREARDSGSPLAQELAQEEPFTPWARANDPTGSGSHAAARLVAQDLNLVLLRDMLSVRDFWREAEGTGKCRSEISQAVYLVTVLTYQTFNMQSERGNEALAYTAKAHRYQEVPKRAERFDCSTLNDTTVPHASVVIEVDPFLRAQLP